MTPRPLHLTQGDIKLDQRNAGVLVTFADGESHLVLGVKLREGMSEADKKRIITAANAAAAPHRRNFFEEGTRENVV